MPETGTSGLMSGERKRSAGSQSEPQATAPLLDSTKAEDLGNATTSAAFWGRAAVHSTRLAR